MEKRTLSSIRWRASKLDLKFKNNYGWTDEQINIIKENRPYMSDANLQKLLSNKSIRSIQEIARLKNIPSKKEYESMQLHLQIQQLCEQGYTNCQISELLKISRSCVTRIVSQDNLKINKETNTKKIICVETGIIYNSIKEAVEKFGITIYDAVSGKKKTAFGYHWRYLNSYDANEVLQQGNEWTSEEDNILIKYYPVEGTEVIKRLVNNRSKSAIVHRAKKLNIKVLANLGGKKTSKSVICIETNRVYNSAREVYNLLGIRVNEVCKNSNHTAGGYHWKYIEDNNKNN